MQETPTPRSPNYMAGFSLIELMVVVAMIAIISAIATPNLRRFLVQAEVRSAVNDWTQALVLAKSEAIKQNRQVTLCPSSDGSDCTATASFEIGWIVKTGTTATVTGDRILADYFPLPRLTMTSNENSPAVTYLANGLPIGSFAGMHISVTEAAAAPDDTLTRYICIARTGRARTFTKEQWLSLPNSECSKP